MVHADQWPVVSWYWPVSTWWPPGPRGQSVSRELRLVLSSHVVSQACQCRGYGGPQTRASPSPDLGSGTARRQWGTWADGRRYGALCEHTDWQTAHGETDSNRWTRLTHCIIYTQTERQTDRHRYRYRLTYTQLSGSVVSALGIRARDLGSISGRAIIPLGSKLGQVVYSHCPPPSFSAPRNGSSVCPSVVKTLYVSFQSLTYEFVVLSQSWCVVTGPADRLRPPLPMVTNVNNGKLTDFTTILLLEISGNEISTYYGTIWKLYKTKNENNNCMGVWCIPKSASKLPYIYS